MSHIVTTKNINVTDMSALKSALARLSSVGFVMGTEGTHKMYSGEAEGLSVKLPGWKYEAVINTKTGEVKYDNYGGHWGKQLELDRLIQAYTVEVAKDQAYLNGMTLEEDVLEDGSIRLTETELIGT